MPGCEGNTISHDDHHDHHQNHDHHDVAKEGNRSFTRLLSKEVSQPNSSCRVYYGETAVAIPFVWESQPGTPKHTLFESSSLPPLTPPPSYSSSSSAASKSARRSASGKPKFDLLVMSSIFLKNKSARARRLSQPSSVFSLSSLSSSSSSSSSSSNYSANSLPKTRVSRNALPLDYEAEYDDDRDSGGSPPVGSGSSPTSTLCFPAMKKTAWRFVTGCYASVNVKNDRIH